MARVADVLHERLADSRSDHECPQVESRLFVDVRLEAFRLGVCCLSLIQHSLALQNRAEIVMGLGKVGLEADRLA
jgi:hypothetical protein